MRCFRLGLAQIAPTLGDLEKNFALHERTVQEAIDQSVNLLVFPELSLTPFLAVGLTLALRRRGQHRMVPPISFISGVSNTFITILSLQRVAPSLCSRKRSNKTKHVCKKK